MNTIPEICTEVNRWIKVKFQHADFNRELPSASSTAGYFRKMMASVINNIGYSVACEVNKTRIDAGLPSTNADIYALSMIDVCFNDATADENHPVPHIAIFTWDDKQTKKVLIQLDVVMKHYECGDDKCDAIKSVAIPSDEITVRDVINMALEYHNHTEKHPDIVDRWLCGDIHYREEHPICPQCEGSIRLSSYDDDNHRHIFCEDCSWVSKSKSIHYMSDFADEKTFKHEYSRVKRIKAYHQEMEILLTQVRYNLAKIHDAYNGRPKNESELDRIFVKQMQSVKDTIDAMVRDIKTN